MDNKSEILKKGCKSRKKQQEKIALVASIFENIVDLLETFDEDKN